MTYPHTIHDEIEYETSMSAYLANQVRLLQREVRKLSAMLGDVAAVTLRHIGYGTYPDAIREGWDN